MPVFPWSPESRTGRCVYLMTPGELRAQAAGVGIAQPPDHAIRLNPVRPVVLRVLLHLTNSSTAEEL